MSKKNEQKHASEEEDGSSGSTEKSNCLKIQEKLSQIIGSTVNENLSEDLYQI